MKAISMFENNPPIPFDITAPINPLVGLGGLSFNQTIKDFQGALVNKNFKKEALDYFDYSIDNKYFVLTIWTKKKEIEININLFTSKIYSMTCRNGYLGKLDNGIGIGSSIKTMLEKDKTFGFNLDTDWFNRYPFDGLIICPPYALLDKCIEAAVRGTDYPDFKIEAIQIMDLDYAKEHYPDGELTF